MSIEDKRIKYQKLLHAMQTGVAFKIEKEGKEIEPKHLRVGVNAALVQTSATANLLMKKGLITED